MAKELRVYAVPYTSKRNGPSVYLTLAQSPEEARNKCNRGAHNVFERGNPREISIRGFNVNLEKIAEGK